MRMLCEVSFRTSLLLKIENDQETNLTRIRATTLIVSALELGHIRQGKGVYIGIHDLEPKRYLWNFAFSHEV